MKIKFAHMREKAVAGGWVNFAVFDARSASGTDSDNADLLQRLTTKARQGGLKVDQSALAFSSNGRVVYYGSRHLVAYLSNGWLPQWTHAVDA
jgi:ethanolamine ammonia-lyase small subunit